MSEWYFCLEHEAVEDKEGCPASERLGPYPTRKLAEHALEIAEARNQRWENDPAWNDQE